MSRPTPETDDQPYIYAANDNGYQVIWVNIEYARKLERERDEVREAIPAGEWVAYEDHKKVHDAASRLLVAINKQLPIGCFTLISSEYYTLKNAIYGMEQNDT
jgi:hypothetical protein